VREPGEREVHELEPSAFLHQVHTFEFWFQSVEGYLAGTQYGHSPGVESPPLAAPDRERLITVLCNYCVGETAALEGASGLVRFAPNRDAKIFLSTQVVDEGRHLEVFLHRLAELGVRDPELEIERRANQKLARFKRRLLELVAQGEWIGALYAQNVILEAMEFAVFHSHARTADPVTREVLEGVVKDERRHIGFGENEIGRAFRLDPGLRARVRDLRGELDSLVLDTFADVARELAIAADRRDELGRAYLEASRRLGLEK
jgi:1,2-phenylacetyl-CoA epoxidase catalytic subunit